MTRRLFPLPATAVLACCFLMGSAYADSLNAMNPSTHIKEGPIYRVIPPQYGAAVCWGGAAGKLLVTQCHGMPLAQYVKSLLKKKGVHVANLKIVSLGINNGNVDIGFRYTK